jgi:hypothetical protein
MTPAETHPQGFFVFACDFRLTYMAQIYGSTFQKSIFAPESS